MIISTDLFRLLENYLQFHPKGVFHRHISWLNNDGSAPLAAIACASEPLSRITPRWFHIAVHKKGLKFGKFISLTCWLI